jgi:ATP-binding cassette subfamily B protein
MTKASTSKGASRSEEKLREFHEESAVGSTQDVRLLLRLWPFVRPHAAYLVVSLGTLLAMAAVSLLRPLIMGDVVRRAELRDEAGLFHDGLLLTGLVVGLQLFTFAQVYTMQLVGAHAMADLREHIFRFLQRLELRFIDRTPVGRLVTRAVNDVDALGEMFGSGVLNALGDLVSLVGIVVAMLVLDWRMSLIAFAGLPVVGVLVNFVRRRSRDAYRDIRAKTARLNAFLNEQVSGVAVVQAFAREARMEGEFDEINEAYRDANKRSIFYEAILDAAIEMVSTLCIASMLWWAGVAHLAAKPVTFGLVVTFSGYIRQFFEPVSLLSTRYTVLQAALSGAERIFQLLDEAETERDDGGDAELEPRSGEVLALDGVTHEYKPGVAALSRVTLSARAGEKIALVGATGSGKTTVASLLLRLYEPVAGTVRVMGRDVREVSRRSLRKCFAVVPQDVVLFSGTILSNVAMTSGPAADRARALRAFDRIGATELFRRRLAKGASGDAWLDVPVDERGSNFSAGERQLLAFARALYADAPILVLDEATASVDSETEARLQQALAAVLEGRTALIIAHRLSTIRTVDRIVVLHKGRVVETGAHDELVARGGVYARLYALQFARAGEAAA